MPQRNSRQSSPPRHPARQSAAPRSARRREHHASSLLVCGVHVAPIASTPTTGRRRRRPVWARCFDQSSAEARPIGQYRPPERTGTEILFEIARGTPRFLQIVRHQSTDSLLAVGLGPNEFSIVVGHQPKNLVCKKLPHPTPLFLQSRNPPSWGGIVCMNYISAAASERQW